MEIGSESINIAKAEPRYGNVGDSLKEYIDNFPYLLTELLIPPGIRSHTAKTEVLWSNSDAAYAGRIN